MVYATAIYNASIIYIDYSKWIPALEYYKNSKYYTNYRNLKNGQSDMIEDISGTGKHYRLDYDGAGAEYTRDTQYEKGKGYVYPGLLPDVPSDKTNWPK